MDAQERRQQEMNFPPEDHLIPAAFSCFFVCE